MTKSIIFLTRIGAAVSASVIFGLLIAGRAGGSYWLRAVGLAVLYGFFFLLGTGYRIVLATFLVPWRQNASAAWSGAAASVALATAGVIAVLSADPPLAARFAAASGLALNVAYVIVKQACIGAGCCRAMQYRKSLDLRRLEMVLTGAIAVAAGFTVLSGRDGAAALLAFGGHLAVRYYSRFARGKLPSNGFYQSGRGLELVPLMVVSLFSAWLMASP